MEERLDFYFETNVATEYNKSLLFRKKYEHTFIVFMFTVHEQWMRQYFTKICLVKMKYETN